MTARRGRGIPLKLSETALRLFAACSQSMMATRSLYRRTFSQGLPDSDFDRRIGPIIPFQLKRLVKSEGRLRHEARPRAAMFLRRVDKEWMAQIDRAGLSSRHSFRPIGS